jgi:hypothetical protein
MAKNLVGCKDGKHDGGGDCGVTVMMVLLVMVGS